MTGHVTRHPATAPPAPHNILDPSSLVRRVRRLLAIAWAAALLAPVAAAGTEANPDVTDAADTGLKDRSLDFLALWLEPYPSGVQMTIKVASGDALVPGDVWLMSFVVGGERYLPAVAVAPDGSLASCLCPQHWADHGIKSTGDFNGGLRDVAFEPGKPAYVKAIIPYESVPGLGPGVVLQDVRAGTTKWMGPGRWDDVDTAFGQDPYVVERAFLPPSVSAALPYALGALVLVAVGAGIAVVVLRRRSAKAPPPAPAQPGAPPPETPRFSLKPPQ